MFVFFADASFLRSGGAVESGRESAEESLGRIGALFLEKAERFAAREGVACEKAIIKGVAPDAVVKAVRESGADLLVIAHEERTFLEKLLVGGDIEGSLSGLEIGSGVEVRVVR